MNNNEHYERRENRVLPEQPTPPPRAPDDEAVNAFARHRDLFVPTTQQTSAPKPQHGVAWVRPSELPTLIGSKWANRGIDLQSELVRRSRRAPGNAAKAGRRISKSAIARPAPGTPTATTREELGL